MSTPVTQAAGGAVWRRRGGSVEVLVVRRQRYDDVSLPKGKLDHGESHKHAALREVLEETGIRCELGPRLVSTSHSGPLGDKRVKWWAMTPLDPQCEPSAEDPDEISEVCWVDFDDAWSRLSYATDREVLASLAERALRVAD